MGVEQAQMSLNMRLRNRDSLATLGDGCARTTSSQALMLVYISYLGLKNIKFATHREIIHYTLYGIHIKTTAERRPTLPHLRKRM